MHLRQICSAETSSFPPPFSRSFSAVFWYLPSHRPAVHSPFFTRVSIMRLRPVTEAQVICQEYQACQESRAVGN